MRRMWLVGLVACGVEPAPPALVDAAVQAGDVRGAPTYFDLDLPDVRLGEENTATFVAETWERVYLAVSLRGEGVGPCPVVLGGHCLHIQAPVTILADDYADEDGLGSITFAAPDAPHLVGEEACFQGVIIRGPGGTTTGFSEPICHVLE